jgi:predicted unusual protein kinase regulating ubiquinone biosynthesis (AarF/ABC1/UbiB family)
MKGTRPFRPRSSVMFTTLAVAARDRKRLAEISGVAARFGLEAVLLRLGLGGGGADETDGPEPLSRRTRQALEALGPTFVKLGQILSTRSDLLPADWIAEFEQLQSAGPTLDFETLRPEVEAALGGPPEQVFARFDTAPLAAASIAQVHRAALHDGTEVVVKIRRPGVRPRVEADLRLIAELARRAELISFVQSLAAGDGARMAEVLGDWTEGTDVSRTSLTAGAERLIARHGQGVVDLPAIVADLMGLMRQERVAAPPDLVLILKALVTIEGVLSRVDPDFDLVQTMKGAWSRALFSSRSPEDLRNRLIGALLDLSAASDDLPRLIRAASRRLTAEPAAAATSDKETARSILSAGRWIAASIVLSGALIAGALLLR